MKSFKLIPILLFIPYLLFVLAVPAISEEMVKRTAKVAELKGSADIKTSSGEIVPAKIGMVLNEGDIVTTKAGSSAVLFLEGSSETATVEMKPNSKMKLSEMLENKKKGVQMTLLDLSLGEILIKAKKLRTEGSKFEVKTPTSIVGVKGTTFSVSVEAIEE